MPSKTHDPGKSEGSWIAPTIPYSPIDALNRRAAAVGSAGYAMATASADYNGHRISLDWNGYRQYYIAQYYWGERVVLARGDFSTCLDAAMREYRRGALGCSVHISLRDDCDGDEIEAAQATIDDLYPELIAGDSDPKDWYTWRHECAARAARDSANPGMLVMRFDWDLMQAAINETDYKARLEAKYKTTYH